MACAVPIFSRFIRVEITFSLGVFRPRGELLRIKRIISESTGKSTILDVQYKSGFSCISASSMIRRASSAMSPPILIHSAQSLASCPFSRRLSAVTIPPCALFIKRATPPTFSSIRSYMGPHRSGVRIPRSEPITSGWVA